MNPGTTPAKTFAQDRAERDLPGWWKDAAAQIGGAGSGTLDDADMAFGLATGQKIAGESGGGSVKDPIAVRSAVMDELKKLQDPSVLADSKEVTRLYNVARGYSKSLMPASYTLADTSLATTMMYHEVYKNDPSAIWFGLAPYATAKVGEAYNTMSGAMGLVNPNNSSVILQGFLDGNKAIFTSMYTAELMYQAGGTAAIRAAVALETTSQPMFNAIWTDENRMYKGALVKSFELRDSARAAFSEGSQALGMEYLSSSLRASADFEQRVVIQPYYNKSYTNGDVTRTLRESMNDYGKVYGWNPIADVAAEHMSTVTILGKSVAFTGDEVGNPNQRMPFVYALAKNLIQGIATDMNGMTGHQRVYQDQAQLIQRTFDWAKQLQMKSRLGQ